MKYPPREMKVEHLNWLMVLFSTELPSQAKLLAAYLNTYMSAKQHSAWPSIGRMQKECSMSRSTVCKYLAVLQEEGWLKKRRKGGVINGKNHASEYSLNWPKEIRDQVKSCAHLDAVEDGGSPSGELGGSPSGELRSPSGELGGSSAHGLGSPSGEHQSVIVKDKRKGVSTNKFVPPAQSDIRDYLVTKGYQPADAEDWAEDIHAYYTSNGWKVGRNPMKCWKSAASKWAKSNVKEGKNRNATHQPGSQHKYAGTLQRTLNQDF